MTLQKLRETFVNLTSPIVVRLNDELGTDVYVSYPQGREEFVGVVDLQQWELESVLKEMGFEQNPLAAWKTLAGTSEEEEGSWRYVNAQDEYYGLTPPRAATEYDDNNGHAHQLHVILYELDEDEGTTAVCVHHELAWDAYPVGHYKGKYYDPQFGKEMFQLMCEDNGVPLRTNVTVDEVLNGTSR